MRLEPNHFCAALFGKVRPGLEHKWACLTESCGDHLCHPWLTRGRITVHAILSTPATTISDELCPLLRYHKLQSVFSEIYN